MQNHLARAKTQEDGMKLLILGASGGTGIEVIRHALERKHDVTAFVRSADRLNSLKDRVDIKTGNLLDVQALAEALRGHDAVVSAFGPRLPITKEDADLLERFAAVLAASMLRAKVNRVSIESTAFLFTDSIIPPTYLFGRLFFRRLVLDALAMETTVRASTLDWTLVRPPQLTEKPYTGHYRVRESHLPPFGFKISRSDVADFMVRSVEETSFIGKIYGIGN
jgi:putative NADH-flavin reductase